MTKEKLKQKILKVLKVLNGREEAIIDTCWAELEKENTELKEHHKSVCENLTNTHRNIREQLIKAIGIIKRWYETNRSARIEPSQELIEVTEQFLKEIEK